MRVGVGEGPAAQVSISLGGGGWTRMTPMQLSRADELPSCLPRSCGNYSTHDARRGPWAVVSAHGFYAQPSQGSIELRGVKSTVERRHAPSCSLGPCSSTYLTNKLLRIREGVNKVICRTHGTHACASLRCAALQVTGSTHTATAAVSGAMGVRLCQCRSTYTAARFTGTPLFLTVAHMQVPG